MTSEPDPAAGEEKLQPPPDLDASPSHEAVDSIGPLVGAPEPSRRALALLALAAVVAAGATGFVGGAFRWCLTRADLLREHVVAWAHTAGVAGWLVPVAAGAAGFVVGRIVVRYVPRAEGSGIQDIEAVWRGQKALPQGRLHGFGIVPAKFLGGLAAIGVGGVLGREGPTVQMGASLGSAIGRWLRLGSADRKVLYSALGGAGLAVAFGAPVGGAIFVVEEVTRSVRVRVVFVTLLATSIAVSCSWLVIGSRPDFEVGTLALPSITQLAGFIVFGLATGLLGAGYNWLVMRLLALGDRVKVSPYARAGLIGAVIGLVLYFDPLLVGGGDTLTQRLLDGADVGVLALLGIVVLRFAAGPLSYSAGVPGGLFAPLLALGATWGFLWHGLAGEHLAGSSPVPYALVGMSAMFAASVRAPLTGIALIIEMTATTALTIPMLAACATAYLAAQLVGSPPIYTSLRRRMLGTHRREKHHPAAGPPGAEVPGAEPPHAEAPGTEPPHAEAPGTEPPHAEKDS